MTPPTRVRFGMIALTLLVAVMLYLDRACLSILADPLKADQNLSSAQFTDLVSAFFWAYALCQIPAGWLGDRFGARWVLAAYLFLWSVCTATMGLVSGFIALLLLRLGCGLFEAGAYPLAAGVVRRWMPMTARGRASACVAVGGRFGGAIAPMLTVALAAGAYGWRLPFVVYGVVGMIGAVIFCLWYRNFPQHHPAVNAEEVALIRGTDPEPTAQPLGWPPIRAMACNRSLSCSCITQFAANFAWVFLITLFPTYLREVFQANLDQQSIYQSIPLYAGIVGMLVGGVLTDRLLHRLGLRWGRALPIVGARIVVGAAYLSCLGLSDPLAITIAMALVAFSTDVSNAPFWAFAQDIGGRHVGGVVGWANMWGNFGAALAPLAFKAVRDQYADPMAGWNAAFVMCAGVQFLGALAALGMDSRERIDA